MLRVAQKSLSLKMALSSIPIPSLGPLAAAAVLSALVLRIIYNLYIHPLHKFHGPWYAASFSIVHAIISVFKREPQWMQSLVRYYGSKLLLSNQSSFAF